MGRRVNSSKHVQNFGPKRKRIAIWWHVLRIGGHRKLSINGVRRTINRSDPLVNSPQAKIKGSLCCNITSPLWAHSFSAKAHSLQGLQAYPFFPPSTSLLCHHLPSFPMGPNTLISSHAPRNQYWRGLLVLRTLYCWNCIKYTCAEIHT